MKKIFMMLAVAASCAMFASCGGEKKDNKENKDAAAATEQAEDAPAATSEVGSDKEADALAVVEIIKAGSAAEEAGDAEASNAYAEQLQVYIEKYGDDEEFGALVQAALGVEEGEEEVEE